MREYLDDIKELLGLKNNLADGKLKIIIENTIIRLRNKLLDNPTSIPDHLKYIITEISIVRFNRIGEEGLKSSSIEGKSSTFYDSDSLFDPYKEDIDAYNDLIEPPSSKATKGRVMLY